MGKTLGAVPFYNAADSGADLPDRLRPLSAACLRLGQPGVELRILKHLFTAEEAEIALLLSAVPETLDRIHRRVRDGRIAREELERTLDRMVAKGAILGRGRGERKHYSKAQLAIGRMPKRITSRALRKPESPEISATPAK